MTCSEGRTTQPEEGITPSGLCGAHRPGWGEAEQAFTPERSLGASQPRALACPHVTAADRPILCPQGSDSEYEVDLSHQKAHSFVNHYISDPTYYNSWRRQQKGISRAQANSYPESDSGEPDRAAIVNSGSAPQGSLFRPKASRTPTPQNPPNPPSQQSTLYRPPSSLAPGSRAPIAGFSSFV